MLTTRATALIIFDSLTDILGDIYSTTRWVKVQETRSRDYEAIRYPSYNENGRLIFKAHNDFDTNASRKGCQKHQDIDIYIRIFEINITNVHVVHTSYEKTINGSDDTTHIRYKCHVFACLLGLICTEKTPRRKCKTIVGEIKNHC